jgi:hypothetical protein
VYYYEVCLKEKADDSVCCVGLLPTHIAQREYNDQHIGWEDGSMGYHGDDGQFYGTGKTGPTFTSGDVIGMGVHFKSNSVFVTKNGKYLGAPFVTKEGGMAGPVKKLFPAVSTGRGAVLEANFGGKPFAFQAVEKMRLAAIALKAAVGASVLPVVEAAVEAPPAATLPLSEPKMAPGWVPPELVQERARFLLSLRPARVAHLRGGGAKKQEQKQEPKEEAMPSFSGRPKLVRQLSADSISLSSSPRESSFRGEAEASAAPPAPRFMLTRSESLMPQGVAEKQGAAPAADDALLLFPSHALAHASSSRLCADIHAFVLPPASVHADAL